LRVLNRSLLVDDLKELGMLVGELSEDNSYINMPFEDAHRLGTTMKMAKVILRRFQVCAQPLDSLPEDREVSRRLSARTQTTCTHTHT
jgi:hypothetical protein